MRAMKGLILFACLAVSAAGAGGAVTNTTVNLSNRWSWATPVGWINCRTDITNGAAFGEFVCSNYFWSSGTGWINLGNGHPTNRIRYTNLSTNDFGVNCYSNGILRGSAWSPNCGWISFENTGAPKVDLVSGIVSGYAWNSSLGWMSFTNITGFLQTDSIRGGDDTNMNTVADAWELTYTNVLGVLGATAGTDSDGDGQTDRMEYIAGTNPLDKDSRLRITALSSVNDTNDLTWTCVPTRTYLILTNSCLTNSSGWGPALGEISTNSTSIATVRLPPVGSGGTCFYRVRAKLPLSAP